MYAIAENIGQFGVSTISRDQCKEWWTGSRWSPSSEEAKTFESREEADEHAQQNCTREHRVVEIDE